MTSTALKLAFAAAGLAVTLGVSAQETPTTADFRPFQISFVPTLGTNGFLSNKIENGVSINIIAGTSKGVRWAEIGGVANMVKGNVGGAQFAGVVNLTSGNVNGGQLAGVLNTSQRVTGAQASGVANIAKGNIKGLQMAGVTNTAHNIIGAQDAGVYNQADSVVGGQLAGVTNIAKTVKGVQAAGVFNSSKTTKGIQVAGVTNISDKVDGFQMAGILNKARVVKGVQLGLVNLSDSCSGLPIGLVSIVRTGYSQIELGTDDMLMANVAYRSGVKKLHTIVGASILPDNSSTVIWGTTFGIGTSHNLSPRTLLDADLMYTQIICNDKFSHDNKLFRAYIGIDRHIFGKMSLAAGITANALVYSTSSTDNVHHMKQLVPYTMISEKINSRNHLAGWIGGRVAIRIN